MVKGAPGCPWMPLDAHQTPPQHRAARREGGWGGQRGRQQQAGSAAAAGGGGRQLTAHFRWGGGVAWLSRCMHCRPARGPLASPCDWLGLGWRIDRQAVLAVVISIFWTSTPNSATPPHLRCGMNCNQPSYNEYEYIKAPDAGGCMPGSSCRSRAAATTTPTHAQAARPAARTPAAPPRMPSSRCHSRAATTSTLRLLPSSA